MFSCMYSLILLIFPCLLGKAWKSETRKPKGDYALLNAPQRGEKNAKQTGSAKQKCRRLPGSVWIHIFDRIEVYFFCRTGK